MSNYRVYYRQGSFRFENWCASENEAILRVLELMTRRGVWLARVEDAAGNVLFTDITAPHCWPSFAETDRRRPRCGALEDEKPDNSVIPFEKAKDRLSYNKTDRNLAKREAAETAARSPKAQGTRSLFRAEAQTSLPRNLTI